MLHRVDLVDPVAALVALASGIALLTRLCALADARHDYDGLEIKKFV